MGCTDGQFLRQLQFPKCLEKPIPLCGPAKLEFCREPSDVSTYPLFLPSLAPGFLRGAQKSSCLSQFHFSSTCCQAWCPGEEGLRQGNWILRSTATSKSSDRYPQSSYQGGRSIEDGQTAHRTLHLLHMFHIAPHIGQYSKVSVALDIPNRISKPCCKGK